MNIKAAKRKIRQSKTWVKIALASRTQVYNLRSHKNRVTATDMVTQAFKLGPSHYQFTFDGEPYTVNISAAHLVTDCSECEHCKMSRELKKKRTPKAKRPAILGPIKCSCYSNCTEVK